MWPDGSEMATAKSQPEVMTKLQDEVDRMCSLVSELAHTLGPVLVQSPDSMPRGPEEASYHDYHKLVIRFGQENSKLAELIHHIKL